MEKKNYLSLDGLAQYDALIKELINNHIQSIDTIYVDDEECLYDFQAMGLYEPAGAEDGSIYTDENGAIYTL